MASSLWQARAASPDFVPVWPMAIVDSRGLPGRCKGPCTLAHQAASGLGLQVDVANPQLAPDLGRRPYGVVDPPAELER